MRFNKNQCITISAVSVLLLLIIVVILLTQTKKETYVSNSIDQDDITFYGRDSCPFCVKMKNQLKNDGLYEKLNVVDVETREGNTKFKKLNVDGVPHFTCKSTGKSSTGFKSTNDLLKDLHLI